MEAILFAETPTLGIRHQWMMRTKLRRRHETVETPFGPIRMKIGEREGGLNATPEYEDCRAAAEARKHRPPRRHHRREHRLGRAQSPEW